MTIRVSGGWGDWPDNVQTSGQAPASPAGCLYAQDVTLEEFAAAFARQLCKLTSTFSAKSSYAGRSFAASLQTVGTELPAIRQKRHLCIRQ